MKKFVFAVPALLLVVVSAVAAAPDFSGTWVLNASRSRNLGMMSSMDYEASIRQSGNTLMVKDTTRMMGQVQSRETHYALDGAPTSNVTFMGDPAKTVTRWEGAKLVTTWTSPGAIAGTATVRTETRFLSPDGKTMTVESTNGSKPSIVFTFDRQ